MKFSNLATNFFIRYGKTRTLSVLRTMTSGQLEDIGIAPELLHQGVEAYPWRRTLSQKQAPSATFKKSIDAREVMFDVNPKEAASNALSQAA